MPNVIAHRGTMFVPHDDKEQWNIHELDVYGIYRIGPQKILNYDYDTRISYMPLTTTFHEIGKNYSIRTKLVVRGG